MTKTRAESHEALFRSIFHTIQKSPEQLAWADLVFHEGSPQEGFEDVEFLWASDRNGSSYLYTTEANGNCRYSVVRL